MELEESMPPVPPRRGQRVKSTILPPFMGGAAFQPVVYQPDDGELLYGIIERRGRQESRVWIGYDLKPRRCPNEKLKVFALPDAPTQAYTEVSAVIGGIGLHLRWNVIFPSKRLKGRVDLHITGITNEEAFKSFVEQTVRPFGLCRYEFATSSSSTDVVTTTVEVPDASNLGMVAAALHCAGYGATLVNETAGGKAKLAIERYDRSEHMWWNQDQARAGPLRDVHRWVFDFIPSEWKVLPFTWQSLAANIDLDPITEADALPLPLRDVFLTRHIEAAKEGSELKEKLTKLRGRPSVTCRLSAAQNRQLLLAAYWTIVAPFDATAVCIAQLLRYRYMLHGYTAREIGGYVQKAEHLGHGANIRSFRNKPQYKRENLTKKMLSKIYCADGTMRGSGFKGTRGKYGHKDFPRYEPRHRMKRTKLQEQQMRQVPTNIFSSYHQVDGKVARSMDA